MADESIRKIYWDSCIFIAWLTDEKRADPEDMLGIAYWRDLIDRGQIALVTSQMTTLEVLDCTLSDEAKDKFKTFLGRDNVALLAMSSPIARIGSEIRNYYHDKKINGGSNTPTLGQSDSIHLATAIYARCDQLHTFDAKDKKDREKRGLIPLDGDIAETYSMSICKPQARQLDWVRKLDEDRKKK